MRILLATDGSSYAREAARFLNRLLHAEAPAMIELAAVRPEAPGRAMDPAIRRRARGFSTCSEAVPGATEVERWFSDAEDQLTRPGRSIERLRLDGDAAEQLVAHTAARDYDLVVAGAKGSGATPFFELGHVARALLQDGAHPTLLVRKGGGGYSRGSHGSSRGHAPIRALIVSAERESAERTDAAPTIEWEPIGAFALRREEIPVLPFLPDLGYQPREVDREARRADADLLILDAGHAPSRRAGIPLSAARTTAWTAPCSVLLVRTDRGPGSDHPPRMGHSRHRRSTDARPSGVDFPR